MNYVDLSEGPIRCRIETAKPLPADAYAWIAGLRKVIEETAKHLAEKGAQ